MPFGPQEPQPSVDQMRSDPEVTVRVCFTFWVSQRQSDELFTSTVKVSVSPTLGFLLAPVILTVSWDPSQSSPAVDADGDDDADADDVANGDFEEEADLPELAEPEGVGVSGPQAVSVHDGFGVKDDAAGAADFFEPLMSLETPVTTRATTITTAMSRTRRRTQ